MPKAPVYIKVMRTPLISLKRQVLIVTEQAFYLLYRLVILFLRYPSRPEKLFYLLTRISAKRVLELLKL